MCLLPERDSFGRPVLFFRFQNVKPEGKCILKDIMTALGLLMEGLNEIEEFLIRGMVYIFDVSGLGPSYLKIIPLENVLKISKTSEKCLVGRHKGFHIVNVPTALSYILNLAIKHSAEKIRSRIKIYRSFDQLDFIDKKSLPKEYGGTIPMKEMSSEFMKKSVDSIFTTLSNISLKRIYLGYA